jgi:hypothetical protein
MGHLIGRRVLSRAEWLNVGGLRRAVDARRDLLWSAAASGTVRTMICRGVIGGRAKPVLHNGQGWADLEVGGSP